MKTIILFVLTGVLLMVSHADAFAQKSRDPVSDDTSVSFKVYGVCEQCKHRIEEALKVKGVKSAEWNIDTKILSLVYDPSHISLERIQKKIISAGHDTYEKKANDAVYNALPSCCHYREMESMDNSREQPVDDSTNSLSKETQG